MRGERSQRVLAVFDVSLFVTHVTQFMARQRISRGQLAALANVHPYTVEQIMDGERTPSLSVVVDLADVCDLSLDRYRKHRAPAEVELPFAPGGHLWVALCFECGRRADMPFGNPVARSAWMDKHTAATGHNLWRLTDG
jgi:transcriptional regulator with XRE-family HTH domain